MNGKKRYILIAALGALLISLLAILPVAAVGEVGFINPDHIDDANSGALSNDRPSEQTWTRQGGQVGIEIDDSDLNATIKRVLIPEIDGEVVGTGATIEKNSNVILIPGTNDTTRPDLDEGTDGKQTVERNDLIIVGYETLRKVTKVEFVDPNAGSDDATSTTDDDNVKITLDRAYHQLVSADAAATVRRIKQTYSESTHSDYNAFDNDDYKTLASALWLQDDPTVKTSFRGTPWNATTVTLDRDIVDSGIGSHVDASATPPQTITTQYNTPTDKGLSLRLKSAVSRGVRDDDVLVLRIDNRGNPETVNVSGHPYNPTNVDEGGTLTIEDSVDRSSDNAYVLFWAREENDTEGVTIRSQARQSPVTLVLRETSPTSGLFSAKVDLIANEVEVAWNNIPAGSVGDVVMLDNTPATDYSGYKVEIPAANRVGESDGTSTAGDTAMQKVKTVADFNREIPRLPVNPRDTVSVRHPDDTSTIRVETTPSVFSAFSPAHNSSSRDSRPELSAQVIDGDSGLKEADIDIIYTVDDGGPQTLDPSDIGYTDEVSGGFAVRARVARVDDETDHEIKWWVKAKDIAGNVTYSDRLPTVDGEANRCKVTTDDDDAATASDSWCQPYVITVDNTDPNMLRAETGRFWDTALSTGDSDDKTEYRASKARTNSVLVIFNEHLDIGTVQATDFEVNDATPQSADVFNVTVRDDNFQTYDQSPNDPPTGSDGDDDDPDTGDGNKAIAGDSVQDEGDKRGYVFLSVNELTSNARPKVELVDDVEDIAGNRRSTGSIASATDRIGPTLSVAVTEGVRPVTNKDVTLSVTSNEDVGTPTVRYYRVKSTSTADGDPVQVLGNVRTDAVITFKSARSYEVKITPNEDGLYTVFVEADDSAGGNTGTIGDETVSIDVDGETTAILFERDKGLAKPDFDPDRIGVNDSFETDDANGFIRIDYSGEAREYYAAPTGATVGSEQTPDNDSDDAANHATGSVPVTGDDLDTHGRVTIVTATLDGNDISDVLNPNSDGNIFQYHLDGMAVGEYDLELTVRDEAGNQNAAVHKGTIKVIERKPYKLALNPGWNLVSLPGSPADTDINAVIPADHPIEAVRGYDPMVPGAWLIAEEDGEGRFTGTLETIEAGTAYWIKTGSFEALEVSIPKPTPGSLSLLPTIQISQGWNLVPILDVDGDFELAAQTDADNYFSGLTAGSIAAIYTYNTVTNSWASVDEDGVELGKGYWVYATKPGVIVP